MKKTDTRKGSRVYAYSMDFEEHVTIHLEIWSKRKIK